MRNSVLIMIVALLSSVQNSFADNTFSVSMFSPELVAGDTIAVEHLDMILDDVNSVSLFIAHDDGHVLIEDTVSSFSQMRIRCLGKTSDALTFYVDSEQQLTLNVSSLKYMDESVPDGGYYEANALRDYFLFEAEKEKLYNLAMAKLDHCLSMGIDDSIQVALNDLTEIQNGTKADWKYRDSFLNRKDCPIAAYLYAKEYGLHGVNCRKIVRHWRKLNPEVRKSGAGRWYQRIMEIKKSLRKRAVATDFNLSCTDGSTVSLKNLKGKYVLLYNWGKCGYVLQSAPHLITLYEKYKEKCEIIALTDTETFSYFYRKDSVDPLFQPLVSLTEQEWKTALTDKSANKQILTDYIMTFTPCVVLISPKGRILHWGDATVLRIAERYLRRN